MTRSIAEFPDFSPLFTKFLPMRSRMAAKNGESRDQTENPESAKPASVSISVFSLKIIVVRVEGLEPPRLAAPEPKSGASTNFATPAVPALSAGMTCSITKPVVECEREIHLRARLLSAAPWQSNLTYWWRLTRSIKPRNRSRIFDQCPCPRFCLNRVRQHFGARVSCSEYAA